MPFFGLIGLLVAFAAIIISLACLGVAHVGCQKKASWWETFEWGGRVAVVVGALALTFCCALLVYCFMSGDNTIEYVAHSRSDDTSSMAWLYKLAGLWAGREGSLLFWAWLIGVFNAIVVFATRKASRPLDDAAIVVAQLVLAAFVGVLLFSESNMPFTATDPSYIGEDGQLTGMASMWGMNTLLEHWAMAIHPPTLFIGYAGLTIPFAYAIAALIVDDDSSAWVKTSTPYVMFSWLLLSAGIGLGSVWAYVVLGWGGYWGWDPVENASLLPWLVGVALIHSFTVYRKRGAFKRWSVFCACLTFSFVILGTFITRSGLVESVHAFEGDPVSLVLFLALIVLSLVAGVAGLVIRRKTFGVATEGDDFDSMASKEAAYYINNLIMIVFAVLLAYMTLSSALPSFLPFGGQALTAGTYNAIARPLGILYCLLIAVCSLLGWGKTDPATLRKNALVPAICAVALFAVLMFYFVTTLYPAYEATMAAGGTGAMTLAEYGPSWYYNGLAVVGLAVASLLFFNAVFMVVRVASKMKKNARALLSALGGGIAHTGMAVVLVGLIGSSMYVTEVAGYMPYDEATDTAGKTFVVDDYELVYADNTIEMAENGDDIMYTVIFDVYKDGEFIEQVEPAVQLVQTTQQQKLVADVISFATEDLFVVYRGVNAEGAFALDVRVNPLILFVWAGFGLIMLGGLVAMFAKRAGRAREEEPVKLAEPAAAEA
ncbi:MAG: cytochrome c biogenesis protein CcsA [Eggerthellaceae bacterium]|nr:cytochrome c biogenesis protein CcsA [Eggerthellaceae bacterium]